MDDELKNIIPQCRIIRICDASDYQEYGSYICEAIKYEDIPGYIYEIKNTFVESHIVDWNVNDILTELESKFGISLTPLPEPEIVEI